MTNPDITKLQNNFKTESEIETILLQYLKSLPEEKLSPQFSSKLHYKLLKLENETLLDQKINEISLFKFWRYSLVTLSIFLIFGLFYLLTLKRFSQPIFVPVSYYSDDLNSPFVLSEYKPQNHLPMNQESIIRLKIKSKTDLKNVTLEISLPNEIVTNNTKNRFRERIVKWTGDLKQGENYITFKARGVKEGEFPVEIKLKKDSVEKKLVRQIKILKI